MSRTDGKYDVAVIGAGHAGVEAALAPARLGFRVLLLTLDRLAVGRMSCNPAIGGLAKGHLVREIDALGGEMARAIDAVGIHFKLLNRSRGPAVQGPRAQADRDGYSAYMLGVVENEPNIDLKDGEAADLIVTGGEIRGLVTATGEKYSADSVILTAGTFLSAVMFTGDRKVAGGRRNEPAAERLGERMRTLGFRTARLKTGTPPRVRRSTVDWSRAWEQKPDRPPLPFSFGTESIDRPQVSCWITRTNDKTHDIIRRNLDRSPLFRGEIGGAGPRYCPSIEDKIHRFAHQPSHHVFLEIEGGDSDLVYPNGLSTSLPEDVQEEFLRSIPGLEECEMVIPGYAVEYDFFPSDQIRRSLETTLVEGLYLAGQMNGTSGYEEAAAQGIMAGINAANRCRGDRPLVLSRAEAYIGVLVDDLVTRVPREPYRMFTSRAEHRLILRHDTADVRLAPVGAALGLASEAAARRAAEKDRDARREIAYLSSRTAPFHEANELTERLEAGPVRPGTKVVEILRRPAVSYDDILPLRDGEPLPAPPLRREVEVRVKYAGYVERQIRLVEKLKKMENRSIPTHFAYEEVGGLSNEAEEKLTAFRPETLGVASRIEGVTPADVSLLVVYLDRWERTEELS